MFPSLSGALTTLHFGGAALVVADGAAVAA
jgi:hypothetical protein